MRKERIKTVILVLLMLNCLQLTGQIWFNKKLWPFGYNFFNSLPRIPVINTIINKLPFSKDTFSDDSLFSNAVKPQAIVINGGSAREVYYPHQKSYGEAYKIINNVISNLLASSSGNSLVIPVDEWQSYLKGKSIFVSYNFNMNADSFAKCFNKSADSFSFDGIVSDFIITGDSVTKKSIVCFLDKSSGIVTKFLVDNSGEEILKYIESATFGKSLSRVFAFELRLDENPPNTSIQRPVLLDSFVLLPMDNESIDRIAASNPLGSESYVFDKIVTAIGYTPSSLRKSVSADGTASYVENSATISIDPRGVIEYNAVEAERGIFLQSGKIQPFNIAGKVLQIAENIWHATGADKMPEINIVSDLTDPKGSDFFVKMNFSYNGIPVIPETGDEEGNAIFAHISNGYLKSFRINLKTFNKTEQSDSTMPIIPAIDKLAENYGNSSNPLIVKNIFKCYRLKEDTASVAWGVRANNNQNKTIIISSES
jgi:hypothetical protein